MALFQRRKASESHMGDNPPAWAHRGSELPEERSPDGHRKDVLATLGSGALVIAGTALLAWLLYSLLG